MPSKKTRSKRSSNAPDRPPSRWVRVLKAAGAGEFIVYFALACTATWPLAANMHRCLPLGTEPTATVPLFNAWTIWWNAHHLKNPASSYWKAPIFHPADQTFALSEAQPVTMAVAPAVWCGSPIIAYNVYLLLGLTLTGWSGYILLRSNGLHRAAAFAGGAMLLMLPMPHHQLGVLQLTPLWAILLTILAVQKFGERPTIRRGILLGAAFSVAHLTCNYYGLFLAVLLPVTAWWLLGGAVRQWRFYAGAIAAIVVATVLTGPVTYAQLEARRQHGMERNRDQIEHFSADWADYTAAPWQQLTRLPEFAKPDRAKFFPLSPGYLKMLLAVTGFAIALFRPRQRWFALFAAALLVAALLFSRGLKLEIAGWRPYGLLLDYLPGFTAIRTVLRFAIFVQISTALLAAFAIDACISAGAMLWKKQPAFTFEMNGLNMLRMTHVLLVFLLSMAAVTEIWPARQTLFTPPSHIAQQNWLTYLRKKTPPDAVLVCLPFPDGRSAKAYQGTTLWMYWGCFHHRTMVNGYSGYFPDGFLELKPLMNKPFPSPDGLDKLRELGVTHCVIERSVASRKRIASDPFAVDELKWLYSDDTAGVDIYELRPPVWLPVDPDNIFLDKPAGDD